VKNDKTNTEEKILQAAYCIFLLYGYHGTSLRQIANKAKINKAAIHYYFRSKERLYFKVIEAVLTNTILNSRFDVMADQQTAKKLNWFLYTELYNNSPLFKEAIKNIYPDKWEEKLTEINSWLKGRSFN
jgi:AcrR family transcriptional regulator